MPSASPDPEFDKLEAMKDIEWADLVTLDLSKFDSPEGKQELASQLAKAMRTSGFFSVKNFGVSKEILDQQVKLAQALFDLPLEEKLPYYDAEAWARGIRYGYRPIGSPLRKIQYQGRHRDNAQIYNIPKLDGHHPFPHPPILQENIKQMENFQREVNEKVVQKLLRIIAIALSLPDENQLAKDHKFAAKGEDQARYIKYEAIPVRDSQANDGIYAAKHTDVATLTLNFRQPIAGLQFLDEDGEFKWIKPWDDKIVVNGGDALSAITGGYFKTGVHRIHAPPKEQIHLDRYAILFFSRPNSNVIMESIKNSPVLQGEKLEAMEGIDKGLLAEEWVQVWIAYLKRQDDIEVAAKAAAEAKRT